MDIPTNVAYLAALSMAAERLLEIFRAFPLFAFPKKPTGPGAVAQDEVNRVAELDTLSIATGIFTAAIAYLIGALPAENWGHVVVFGVLAGAGSGFWNAVLSYLLQLKDLNKALTASAIQPPAGTKISRITAA